MPRAAGARRASAGTDIPLAFPLIRAAALLPGGAVPSRARPRTACVGAVRGLGLPGGSYGFTPSSVSCAASRTAAFGHSSRAAKLALRPVRPRTAS